MTLGEKLRSLRQQHDLTQPQLAEAVGIEQSYLSKLENGKSIPSADVLGRILDVFSIDIGDLLDGLDRGCYHQLRQIPQVVAHLNQHRQLIMGDRRRWLILSAFLLAVGAALIYAGHNQLLVSGVVYNYESIGIEPDRITGSHSEMITDYDFQHTTSFRGLNYITAVPGGLRLYRLTRQEHVTPWQNKTIAALGVLLAVLGLAGLAMEHKLARSRL